MNNSHFNVLAFDADDTLWVNEPFYREAEVALEKLLSRYIDASVLTERLYERETHNLRLFGYGAKGFTLSMIETAVELSQGQISGRDIQDIIELGKALIQQPIELLPHVRETIHELAGSHRLMIITKGDLFDQESKIARSGLSEYFAHVEIVSEKNDEVYAALLQRYQIQPEHFLMVGNSLRSDILPIVRLGSHAVHIPYETTWAHELVTDGEREQHAYTELENMGELPAHLTMLDVLSD